MAIPETIPHGTDDWFAARVGKWTASMAPALMDTVKSGAPSKKAVDLTKRIAWERLAGQPYEARQSYAMRRGQDTEPEALMAYEALTMATLAPGGLIVSQDLPVAATPDGFVDEDGLVEAKCPDSGVKFLDYLTTDALAAEYGDQCQFQLWVTDRQWCDLFAYDPRMTPARQIALTRLYRDEGRIAEIAAAVEDAEARVAAIVSDLSPDAEQETDEQEAGDALAIIDAEADPSVEAFADRIARMSSQEAWGVCNALTEGMGEGEAKPYREALAARLDDLRAAERLGEAAIMGGVSL